MKHIISEDHHISGQVFPEMTYRVILRVNIFRKVLYKIWKILETITMSIPSSSLPVRLLKLYASYRNGRD